MLLFADGFDHYGTTAHMLDGVYAQNSSGILSAAQPATGANGWFSNGPSGLFTFEGLRKVLPAAKDKIGAMGRFYFPGLPSYMYTANIFSFLTASPQTAQLCISVDPNGCIRCVRGQSTFQNSGDGLGGTLLFVTDPLIVSDAQNHIEVQTYLHDAQGWVRIAINGVHKYEITGIDTKHNADNVVSIGQQQTYLSVDEFFMDDYVVYDFLGDPAVYTDWCPTVDGAGKATNYMGEWQVMPLFPTADTAEADWGKSAGVSGFALIDEHSPDDNDYIFSTAAGDISEFDFEDLPVDITVVRGVMLVERMSKSDAGAALFKGGFKSAAAVGEAAEKPITVIPTYWWDFINLDPNTAARWTRAGLNAAKMRLNRTA